MKIKKSWYTLIELLLVVIIIWVLWIAFRDNFKPKNKDIMYGEACVNNIYSDISSFINNALTSKNILSGLNKISPIQYIIDINPNGNTISLKYKESESAFAVSYKQLNLTGNMPPNYYCDTNAYTMILSWNNTIVEINKWFKENSSLKNFNINNSNSLYEKIFLKLCPHNNNIVQYDKCKEVWLYEVDVSIQNIKRSTCLNTNSGWNCDERTQ